MSAKRSTEDLVNSQARALASMARLQAEVASNDPRFLDATAKLISDALIIPEVEVRGWYDHLGEVTLARDTIQRLLTEISADGLFGVKVVERIDNRDALTITWELSNGSAIKIGFKAFKHISDQLERK